MPKHRIDFRVVVSNSTQALSVYDHMRGLAIHAVTLNPEAANAEPAWSRVEELVEGVLVERRSYVGTVDGAETTLGAGPFVVSGMAPYPDQSHADNALAHAQALAEQGAVTLTGAQMAGFLGRPPRHSTGSVHVCYHEEGLPCSTGVSFAVALPEPADVIEWTAGETVVAGDIRLYGGISYICIQGHTTMAGWEPPNVPALWGVA